MHRRLFAAPSPVPRRGRARRPYYSLLSLIGPARASGMSPGGRCSVTPAHRAIEPGAAWLQSRMVQKQCAIHHMCRRHAGIPFVSALPRVRSVRRRFVNLFEWSVDAVSAAWRAWPPAVAAGRSIGVASAAHDLGLCDVAVLRPADRHVLKTEAGAACRTRARLLQIIRA
jgi:hypothetical protein